MPTLLQIIMVMFAFAANSLLCRMALASGDIDPASFTLVRVVSGALMLLLLGAFVTQAKKPNLRLNLDTALISLSLFGYAAFFSFAYITLSTGTGALLLFGTVQLTLISWSYFQGHRFALTEWLGIAVSFAGFVLLVLPSAEQPSVLSAALMVISGLCWALFTVLGKRQCSGLSAVTNGFVGASALSLLLLPIIYIHGNINLRGLMLAVISGGITSGLGYFLWYQLLPKISTLKASISQLSVPAIALLLGNVVLQEALSIRIIMLSAMILVGIAITFLSSKRKG